MRQQWRFALFSLFPTAALATDKGVNSYAVQNDSVAADLIDAVTIPDNKTEEATEPEHKAVTFPDTDSFHSNEDFKPYDPEYPEKAQYGDYTLRIPDLRDRLTFSVRTQKQLIGTLYAPGVSESKG